MKLDSLAFHSTNNIETFHEYLDDLNGPDSETSEDSSTNSETEEEDIEELNTEGHLIADESTEEENNPIEFSPGNQTDKKAKKRSTVKNNNKTQPKKAPQVRKRRKKGSSDPSAEKAGNKKETTRKQRKTRKKAKQKDYSFLDDVDLSNDESDSKATNKTAKKRRSRRKRKNSSDEENLWLKKDTPPLDESNGSINNTGEPNQVVYGRKGAAPIGVPLRNSWPYERSFGRGRGRGRGRGVGKSSSHSRYGTNENQYAQGDREREFEKIPVKQSPTPPNLSVSNSPHFTGNVMDTGGNEVYYNPSEGYAPRGSLRGDYPPEIPPTSYYYPNYEPYGNYYDYPQRGSQRTPPRREAQGNSPIVRRLRESPPVSQVTPRKGPYIHPSRRKTVTAPVKEEEFYNPLANDDSQSFQYRRDSSAPSHVDRGSDYNYNSAYYSRYGPEHRAFDSHRAFDNNPNWGESEAYRNRHYDNRSYGGGMDQISPRDTYGMAGYGQYPPYYSRQGAAYPKPNYGSSRPSVSPPPSPSPSPMYNNPQSNSLRKSWQSQAEPPPRASPANSSWTPETSKKTSKDWQPSEPSPKRQRTGEAPYQTNRPESSVPVPPITEEVPIHEISPDSPPPILPRKKEQRRYQFSPTEEEQKKKRARSKNKIGIQTEHDISKQRILCKKFCSDTVIKVVNLYNREQKLEKEEFKKICRKLTHQVLDKEARNHYVISEATGVKIHKFVDQYFCSTPRYESHPRVKKLKEKVKHL